MSVIWVVIHGFLGIPVPITGQAQKLITKATSSSSLKEGSLSPYPTPGFPVDTPLNICLQSGAQRRGISMLSAFLFLLSLLSWPCTPAHWRHNLCLLSLTLLKPFASSKFRFECFIQLHWALNFSWCKCLPLSQGRADLPLYLLKMSRDNPIHCYSGRGTPVILGRGMKGRNWKSGVTNENTIQRHGLFPVLHWPTLKLNGSKHTKKRRWSV